MRCGLLSRSIWRLGLLGIAFAGPWASAGALAQCNILVAGTDHYEFTSITPDQMAIMDVDCATVTNLRLVDTDGFDSNGLSPGGTCDCVFTGGPTDSNLLEVDISTDPVSIVTPGTSPMDVDCCNEDMAFDGTYLWRADFSEGPLAKFLPDGSLVEAYSQTGLVGAAWVFGLGPGKDGLWISRWSARQVGLFDEATNGFDPRISTESAAGGLAFIPGCNILWVGLQGGKIQAWDMNPAVPELVVGSEVEPFGLISNTVDGLTYLTEFTCWVTPHLEALEPVCEGEEVLLDASGTFATSCDGQIEYRFREGATVIRTWSPDPTYGPLFPTSSTSYAVEVRCSTEPDCQGSSELLLEVVPYPEPVLEPSVEACVGESILLDASASVDPGCPGGLEYEWREGATVLRPADPDPTWSPPTGVPGTTTYTLVVRCAGEPFCESTTTVEVELWPVPAAVPGADVAVCVGEPVLLDGSASADPGCPAGLEYEWREGVSVVRAAGPDPTFAPSTAVAGTRSYTLLVRCMGAPDCESTAAVEVAVFAAPVAEAGPGDEVCEGEEVLLDGSGSLDPGCPGGLEYEWREGVTVVRPAGPDPTFAPPTAAEGAWTYTLLVRCADPPGCEASDEVRLEVLDCTLAVTFADWGARRLPDGDAVEVSWETLRERDTMGFELERAPKADGPWQSVRTVLAVGPGHTYRVLDEQAGPAELWYRIVEVTLSGQGTRSQAFKVTASRNRGGRSRSGSERSRR